MGRVAASPLPTYHFPGVHAPSVSLRTFRALSLAASASYALLVVTGGAVRLSGSGLGCPDWPTCTETHLTAALSLHPMIEFGNRLVTVAVSVLSIIVFLSAWCLPKPRRRDLLLLASGILAGLAAQVVLGGLVVLFKLNPYLVALHFVLTLVVLGVALLCWFRTGVGDGKPSAAVTGEVLWLTRLQLAVLGALIIVGTLVSGAGPHAGAKGTKRVPVSFRDIAELHSTIALFLIGMTLGGLFLLHQSHADHAIQKRARFTFEVYLIQGALGFTQYFLHDAAVVIEFHLAGATTAFVATLLCYLHLYRWPQPLAALAEARDPTTSTESLGLRAGRAIT